MPGYEAAQPDRTSCAQGATGRRRKAVCVLCQNLRPVKRTDDLPVQAPGKRGRAVERIQHGCAVMRIVLNLDMLQAENRPQRQSGCFQMSALVIQTGERLGSPLPF